MKRTLIDLLYRFPSYVLACAGVVVLYGASTVNLPDTQEAIRLCGNLRKYANGALADADIASVAYGHTYLPPAASSTAFLNSCMSTLASSDVKTRECVKSVERWTDFDACFFPITADTSVAANATARAQAVKLCKQYRLDFQRPPDVSLDDVTYGFYCDSDECELRECPRVMATAGRQDQMDVCLGTCGKNNYFCYIDCTNARYSWGPTWKHAAKVCDIVYEADNKKFDKQGCVKKTTSMIYYRTCVDQATQRRLVSLKEVHDCLSTRLGMEKLLWEKELDLRAGIEQ